MSKKRNIRVTGYEDPAKAQPIELPEGAALPEQFVVKEAEPTPEPEPEEVEEIPAGEVEEVQPEALEEEVEAEVPKEQAEEPEADDDVPLPSEVQALIQKKIDKLTKQKKEAQERAAALEERLKVAPVLPQVPQIYGEDWYIDPQTRQRVEMPKADDYANNTPKYFEDMRRFSGEKENVKRAVRDYQLKHYADQQAQEEYNRRAQAAIKDRYPDFIDVVATPLMEAVFDHSHVEARDIIRDSERGPDIAYYLGKNPDYLRAMQQMSKAQVLREIGRLEGLMESTLKPKTVSKAPAPVKSAGNLSGASAKVTTAKGNDQVNYKELRERLKARR